MVSTIYKFKVGDILHTKDKNHIQSLIITGHNDEHQYGRPTYSWKNESNKEGGIESVYVIERYYFKIYNYNKIWLCLNV